MPKSKASTHHKSRSHPYDNHSRHNSRAKRYGIPIPVRHCIYIVARWTTMLEDTLICYWIRPLERTLQNKAIGWFEKDSTRSRSRFQYPGCDDEPDFEIWELEKLVRFMKAYRQDEFRLFEHISIQIEDDILQERHLVFRTRNSVETHDENKSISLLHSDSDSEETESDDREEDRYLGTDEDEEYSEDDEEEEEELIDLGDMDSTSDDFSEKIDPYTDREYQLSSSRRKADLKHEHDCFTKQR